MSTPHDDLQQLYEDASAMHGEQPAPTVRTAVLAHAAMLAQSRATRSAEATKAPRSAANWPHWKSGLVASVLLVPLLGMLMLHMKDAPEWQEPMPASPRAEVAIAAKSTADASVAVAPAPAARHESAAAEATVRKAQKTAPAIGEAAPAVAPMPATAIAPAPLPGAPPAAPVLSYAPAPPQVLADAAPSPAPDAARAALQGHVGAAAGVEQRADRALAGQNRAREFAPLTSRYTSAPMASPAPPPTVILAPGIPRSDAYLLMAAQKGDMPMLLEQLHKGASLQAQDSQGRTALMWAAIGGHSVVIQHLLGIGADRAATDKQGLTALQHAQQAGQKDAAALLE